MPLEHVILVDAAGREVGHAEKLSVHRSGALHRAFSVFLFDGRGRMLLQRRATGKYHTGGLLSNACCSHPRPGEPTAEAAHRRLREEMGIACPLEEVFTLVYRADLAGGLCEHEYDHVFVGRFDGRPVPDPAEVSEWRWATVAAVAREMADEPEGFTPWFRLAFARVVEAWERSAGRAAPMRRTGT